MIWTGVITCRNRNVPILNTTKLDGETRTKLDSGRVSIPRKENTLQHFKMMAEKRLFVSTVKLVFVVLFIQ